MSLSQPSEQTHVLSMERRRDTLPSLYDVEPTHLVFLQGFFSEESLLSRFSSDPLFERELLRKMIKYVPDFRPQLKLLVETPRALEAIAATFGRDPALVAGFILSAKKYRETCALPVRKSIARFVGSEKVDDVLDTEFFDQLRMELASKIQFEQKMSIRDALVLFLSPETGLALPGESGRAKRVLGVFGCVFSKSCPEIDAEMAKLLANLALFMNAELHSGKAMIRPRTRAQFGLVAREMDASISEDKALQVYDDVLAHPIDLDSIS